MKKALKWAGIVVAVLIVIGIVSAAMSDKPTTTTTPNSTNTSQPAASTPSTQPTTTSKPTTADTAKPAATKPANKPTINKDEFTQLKNGMTYQEAVSIIGGEGEVMSEVGSPGDSMHTIMYMWKGEGDIGANANAMFQGGKLNTKAQMGLK